MSDSIRTVADATVEAVEAEGRERALLLVYDGVDGGHTRVIELPDGGEVVVGRSRAASISVDSERVSRQHARILRHGREVLVEDLGSRNGTRVDGERITGRRRLWPGDQVDVGPATIVLSVTSALEGGRPVGSPSHLEERLASEADRGVRYRRRFGLLALHLDGEPDAVDAAIERIGAELRPMDVLADYGPSEIVVLAPELERADADQLARRLVDCAGAGDAAVTARAGLALFPEHGTQPGEILSRALSALRRARASGAAAPVADPPPEGRVGDDAIVIEAPEMHRVYALVRRVAPTSMTVLIIGETGVGKELVAEQIHRQGPRCDQPFLKLNCAAIPETLLESELFGHERGAFTGADRRKRGYFEAADGGTIFLDEIGEMPAALQAKLLRVLEERRFTRVGGTEEVSVDVRAVCATNRDLEAEVRAGAFREDLFFRVSAFTILVPPLRDRRPEILPLARRFLAEVSRQLGMAAPRLSPAAEAALEAHAWPGNVRELRNALERAVVVQSGGVIEPVHLPDRVRTTAAAQAPAGDAGHMRDQIAEVERATIVAALEACGGNQTHAAERLGISRRALIYKLEKHGLKRPPASRR